MISGPDMEGSAVKIMMIEYPGGHWFKERGDRQVPLPKGTSRATAAALGFPCYLCWNMQDPPAQDGIKMGISHGRAYVEALLGRNVQCPLAPMEIMRRLEGSQLQIAVFCLGWTLKGGSLAIYVFRSCPLLLRAAYALGCGHWNAGLGGSCRAGRQRHHWTTGGVGEAATSMCDIPRRQRVGGRIVSFV